MDDKKEDLISFNTPNKSGISGEKKGCSPINEEFHDVKDKNAFFQRTKLFDIDNSRESLMLLKNLDDVDIGRKSLGISREYLGIARESLDFGRESLGILPMNVIDEKLDDSNNISNTISSILNKAILYSNSFASPFLSKSMYKSLKTPDSLMFGSFDYPEVFSPMEREEKVSNNLLKIALTCSKNVNDKNMQCKWRRRTHSQITTSEIQKIDIKEARSYNFDDSILMEARVLASKIGDSTIFEEKGEICGLDYISQPEWANECNENVNVNDIVISKDLFKTIEETLENAKKNLETEYEENKKSRCSSNSNQNESQTNCDKISLSNILSPNATEHTETVLNLSRIFQNKSFSTSKISYSSGKSSKDAKEILENLSEILSCENLTTEQKSEGQNLLYSLADILYNSRSLSRKESSDDSGHSSIENEQDVNNHSPKILGNENSEKSLELSKHPEKRELRRSISCPNANSNEKPANIPQVLKNCQVNIPGTLNKFKKLKPKKAENKKRGPLKAVLPLGNMSKVLTKQNKVNCTPPRSDGPSFGDKRTSTPRMESKLCPVAQSTPDDEAIRQKKTQISPSQLPKPKFNCPVSPLARPNNSKEPSVNIKGLQRTLTDSSLSKLRKVSTVTAMSRRKSSDDIKLKPTSGGLQRSNSISKNIKSSTHTSSDKPLTGELKRSNSISKDTKLTVSTNSEKPTSSGLKRSNNVSKNVKSSTTTNDNNSNNTKSLLEKNRFKNPGIKSFSLISKFRRSAGKENLPQ